LEVLPSHPLALTCGNVESLWRTDLCIPGLEDSPFSRPLLGQRIWVNLLFRPSWLGQKKSFPANKLPQDAHFYVFPLASPFDHTRFQHESAYRTRPIPCFFHESPFPSLRSSCLSDASLSGEEGFEPTDAFTLFFAFIR